MGAIGQRLVEHPRRGLVVVGLFVLMLVVGAFSLPPIGEMADRGVGIIEYELARTTAEAERLNGLLGEEGRDALRTSLWLDYPFLVAYGVFGAALATVMAARSTERGRVGLGQLGRWVPFAPLLAALCDAIENAALFRVGAGHSDQPWPGIAFGFASTKFALLAVALVYGLVSAVATLPGLARRPGWPT
jgi:hypothetical protein